jgi:2-polyprenyl-3-methyl-5-hydroxy-6-metoxy-1,4-benzoquinol methylase
MNRKIEEMLHTNERQHEYYEKASGSAESPLNSQATNFWRRLRHNAFSVFRNAEIRNSIDNLQEQWFGDVSRAKVLDLGLGEGNPLSLKLARQAREYVAIDLSSARMEIFRRKLADAGIQGAKTYAGDFLSDSFPEKDFDAVYAMAIFHHFKHIEAFLEALSRRMSPGGIAITLDPIQTWLPIKLIRMAYRPFQTDADWEYPFTQDSLAAIQRTFDIECVQGIYGRSKWAMPIGLFNPEMGRKYAQQWHMRDLQYATRLDKARSCLRVAFKLRKAQISIL